MEKFRVVMIGSDFDTWEDGELDFAGCLHQERSEHPPAEAGLTGLKIPGHDVCRSELFPDFCRWKILQS